MYTGQSRINANAEFGATHLIVHKLIVMYTGKGHEVYMDTYYTSPAIADELASNDMGLSAVRGRGCQRASPVNSYC